MKKLITYFVRNPVAANLLMFLMFVGGIFGYFSLQREFIPQTTINGMSVSVSWPGASPRDVEQQLVVRIEEAVDGLDGIDYIEGNAWIVYKTYHRMRIARRFPAGTRALTSCILPFTARIWIASLCSARRRSCAKSYRNSRDYS